jgi:hypothetical protein
MRKLLILLDLRRSQENIESCKTIFGTPSLPPLFPPFPPQSSVFQACTIPDAIHQECIILWALFIWSIVTYYTNTKEAQFQKSSRETWMPSLLSTAATAATHCHRQMPMPTFVHCRCQTLMPAVTTHYHWCQPLSLPRSPIRSPSPL